MTTDTKTIVKRVTNYGPKPRSVKQALIQAHAFLAEEGQWVKNEFFEDGDPKEAYEKAECSSWSACAMGALGLVTGEMPVKVTRQVDQYITAELHYEWQNAIADGETDISYDDWIKRSGYEDEDSYYEWIIDEQFDKDRKPLSTAAAKALVEQMPGRTVEKLTSTWHSADDHVSLVVEVNDMKGWGRTRILDLFEKAIRAKGGEPLVPSKPAKNHKAAKR